MTTITLKIESGLIVAHSTDPRVRELFGTDTLPTPYTAEADRAAVIRAIAELNPDALVRWQ